MSIRKIGFIGLGAMGFPMVKRLLNAGSHIQTAAYKQNPIDVERAQQLEGMGAKVMDGFPAVARDVDLVLTILPEDKQVKAVLLDEEFYNSVDSNTIILEMTSCAPQTVQEIGKRYSDKGVRVFDGPVSGGTAGAENGTLTIFGSGKAEVLEEIKEVLDVLAAKVYFVGELGSGKALKAVNQMMTAVNMLAVAEGFAIAKKQGIDPEIMYEVIKESAGGSYVFDRKFNNLVKNKFDGGFKLSLMRKDLRIALSSVENIPLPFSKLAYDFYLMAAAYDNFDYSVISKLLVDDLKD